MFYRPTLSPELLIHQYSQPKQYCYFLLLPSSYKTKQEKPKIAFIIHTINQNFNNNKWTTKITGQALNIRFDESDKVVYMNQPTTYNNAIFNLSYSSVRSLE